MKYEHRQWYQSVSTHRDQSKMTTLYRRPFQYFIRMTYNAPVCRRDDSPQGDISCGWHTQSLAGYPNKIEDIQNFHNWGWWPFSTSLIKLYIISLGKMYSELRCSSVSNEMIYIVSHSYIYIYIYIHVICMYGYGCHVTLYIGQQHPITVYRTVFWVCVVLVLILLFPWFLDRILFHTFCNQVVLVLQMHNSLDVSAPGHSPWILDWPCYVWTPLCNVYIPH